VGRIIAIALGKAIGQPVAVRNLASNGGIDALNAVKMIAAHEIRIGLATNAAVIPSQLYPRGATYKVFEDFEWIGVAGTYPNALVVAPSDPVATLQEWMERVRTSKRPLRFGAGPSGSTGYLAGRHLAAALNVTFVHMLMVTADEGYLALHAGAVDVYIDGLPNALEETTRGGGRILAVTSMLRSPALPEVSAFGELWPNEDYSVFAALVVAAKETEMVRARIKSAWYVLNQQQLARPDAERAGMNYLGLALDDVTRYVEDEFLRHARRIARFGATNPQ
jgi:tripartite-type tricarboxylate transporter receptor subunit TctC